MNSIRNNPVTIEDVNLSGAIFGPDIGGIQGKTTRSKPNPVVSDYIEILPELVRRQQNVTLCIDTMFINGIAFFTTISRNIMYRTAEAIRNQGKDEYIRVLKNVIKVYQTAGFKITRIHADNEFRPIIEGFEKDFSIIFNFSSAKEHVPEAERNNRLIKERVRATFHQLPFKTMPKVMLQVLVMVSTKKLNYFPPKGGTSIFYSPRMIMH
jgi:hypothetical protein